MCCVLVSNSLTDNQYFCCSDLRWAWICVYSIERLFVNDVLIPGFKKSLKQYENDVYVCCVLVPYVGGLLIHSGGSNL